MKVILTLCSTVTLPQASALMQTAREHCPEYERYIFLFDVQELTKQSVNGVNLVNLESLNISQYRNFLFGIDRHDLPLFLLPYVFNYLYTKGAENCFFLSESTLLYSSLHVVQEQLEKCLSIVIPYQIEYSNFIYPTLSNRIGFPGSINPCLIGLNNLHPVAKRFTYSWISNNEAIWNRYTENVTIALQSWVDRICCLFDDIRVLRFHGVGAGYWSNVERHMYRDGAEFYVSAEQLVLFDHCDALNGKVKIDCLEDVWLELFNTYRSLVDGTYRTNGLVPECSGFCSIPGSIKRHYRTSIKYRTRYSVQVSYRAVLDSIHISQKANKRSFIHKASHRLDRIIEAIRTRRGSDRFARHFHEKNSVQAPKRYSLGLNIIGYARSETGLGQSLRSYARAAETSEIRFCILNTFFGNTSGMNDLDFIQYEREEPEYGISIMNLNPPELLEYLRLSRNHVKRTYRIGVWFWEVLELPGAFSQAFKSVDEIWASSTFLLDIFSANTGKPVIHIPLCIDMPHVRTKARADFGLSSDDFVFLTMYDVHSTQERKNPEGVIKAFLEAFSGEKRIRLIVKTNNALSRPAELQKLTYLSCRATNIILMNENASREEIYDLMNCCDAYISLHRAEGFGLCIAESMALGRPVIATGWSGNMDYMTPYNSYPVNYRLVHLEENYGPYPKGSTWADPDIRHASELMREIVKNRDEARMRGERGRRTIEEKYSATRVGGLIRDRMNTIHEEWGLKKAKL
jgi:glycosyltransferase involved in cell wall biosynthesis